MTTIRVLTYNVRSLRDSVADVVTVIQRCEPDVVCIQEAPRFLCWRRKARRLAARAGLAVVTGGRPAGAMLLLARPDVRVLDRRDLRLTKTPRLHQRGLAVGVLEIGGTRVTVASMHLGLRAGERRRHVKEIFELLDGDEAPLVLAGDVNEDPGDPAWNLLEARLQDAYAVAGEGPPETVTAVRPYRRIDGVFVDPRLRVRSCRVVDLPEVRTASDHRPVLAVVEAD